MTTAQAGWLETREKGTELGIRFFVWLMRLFGRAPARAFLYPVVFYYVLFYASVRRASREYLERAGVPSGFWAVYRHVLRFAQVVLDRLFLARGRTDMFDVESFGREHLFAHQDRGEGAILIGAHLGSFEAMRMMSAAKNLRINIVGYFHNARRINAMLERLDPRTRTRLVEIQPGSVGFVLAIKELIEKGELVALLGDRVGPDGRAVKVPFFGAPAAFPAGPYLLASVLKCPVYLVFGIYRGKNRYDLYCEPFAERIDLPRGRREEALAEWVAKYAERLEHHCRKAPDNWFNFFDFWKA